MKRNQFFQLFTLASASLTAIVGRSCHKHNFCRDKYVFCRDKHVFCRDKNMLVAKKVCLSRQTRVCCDKYSVTTKLCLSRQKFCSGKYTFVPTKGLFVATNMVLVAAPVNDTQLARLGTATGGEAAVLHWERKKLSENRWSLHG